MVILFFNFGRSYILSFLQIEQLHSLLGEFLIPSYKVVFKSSHKLKLELTP